MADTTARREDSPDYTCAAYDDMRLAWERCHDAKEGIDALRANAATYLPRFEVETPQDYAARLNMTFSEDYYPQTLADLVGLALAEPPQLGPDVPDKLKELWENVDGEGNHGDVFTEALLDAALDDGHAVLFTDYPSTPDYTRLTPADLAARELRPYWTIHRGRDVTNWRVVTVGGVRVVVQLTVREHHEEDAGAFGTRCVDRYRVFRQAVLTDDATGRPAGLGAITWALYEEQRGEGAQSAAWVAIDEGEIVGPTRIPARIVYGGERRGVLHTRPFLYGVALNVLELTQVHSEYASAMHQTNVVTPVFTGIDDTERKVVQLGQGLALPMGATAAMLEPSGNAIGAARTRMEDIKASIRRKGGTVHESETERTATEVAASVRARNARLSRAVASLKDALEGGLADMAAFLGIPEGGGSVTLARRFAVAQVDQAILGALTTLHAAGEIPLSVVLHYMRHGELPDDADVEMADLEAYARATATRDAAQSPGAGAAAGQGAGEGYGAGAAA